MPRRNNGPKLFFREDRRLFYIGWTERGRSRKCCTGTADSAEAQIRFAEWLQGQGGRHGPSDPAQVRVTDALNASATERGPKVEAPRVIGCAIEAMSPYWQGLTVLDVTPLTCARYGEWRGRSKNTIRRELAVLQAAINWGYKNAKLTRSVAVALPDRPRSKTRWLTKHEAALLLRASRTEKGRLYLPLFILIGLYTGRRKEAILSLRWPQVDLDAGRIDFEKPDRDQTKKRRGLVPIPAKLLPHLRRARRWGSDLGPVLHINSRPIGNIKKGFDAACRRAGIEGVTPHCLRHTAATWIMQSGKVPTWEAAGFLAMSEKMLLEVYGHHHPDYMRAAAEAISKRGSRMGA
jgi:integrase